MKNNNYIIIILRLINNYTNKLNRIVLLRFLFYFNLIRIHIFLFFFLFSNKYFLYKRNLI